MSGDPTVPCLPRGFTLIELMVVLVIVALLATVSWHGYGQHVIKRQRAEGRAAILQVLLQQERLRLREHRYRSYGAQDTAPEWRRFSGEVAATSAYEIAATPCADADLSACVKVIATPRAQVLIDDQCGALGADTLGRRQPATPGCW